MPTSYTSLLGLALPVTGELSGTWGDTVNDYITKYLDASVAGTQTISGSQTAVTLSVTNGTTLVQVGSGSSGSAQYNIINCTGNPAATLVIDAPKASKTYVVNNATSTNQSVTLRGGPSTPTTGVTLVAGEKAVVAWNGSDFIKVATSTADGVTTLSFGSTGLTPSTATSGAVTVAGTLVAANGGTGQSSYTTGDLLYATGSTALSKLGIGTNGQILTSTGTAPQWSTLSGVAVTTFSAGTTGFTPSTATSGAVTLAGTLATTNGGTGLTSFTANGVVYASSSSALTTGSGFTFNGSALGLPSASVSVGLNTSGQFIDVINGDSTNAQRLRLTTSGTDGVIQVTRTAGTVPNLIFRQDASELMRLTSTGLGIGTSSPGSKLDVQGGSINTSSFVTITPTTTTLNAIYRATNTGGTFYAGLDNSAGGVTGTAYAAMIWHTGAYPISFGTNNTLRATLDSSGNLGIGTSSPAAKLDVVGSAPTIRVYSNNSGATTATMLIDAFDNTGFSDLSFSRAQLAVTQRIRAIHSGTVTNQSLAFWTGGVETMRLDGSGNLGLGVTPSAWNASGAKVLQMGALGAFVFGDSSSLNIGSNAAYISAWQYVGTGFSTRYEQQAGQHRWYNAPSGTAGNAISFTQAMTLDASGNLMVGSTSSSAYANKNIDVNGTGDAAFVLRVGGTTTAYFYSIASQAVLGTSGAVPITFNPNGTERARITSGGVFLVGRTSPIITETFSSTGYGLFGGATVQGIIGDAGSGLVTVGAYSNHALEFRTNNTERARITSGGDLLVGTTSTTPANANGLIAYGGTDAGILYLQRTTGTDQLRFYVGGNRLGYLNTASSAVTLGTANFPLVFATNDTERARITSGGNVSIGGSADRGTTVGTAALQLFNGTAPAGTLTNGVSLYSSSGDLNFMNSAGNGFKVGYRNLPPVGTKTGSYTLATGDVGKYVQVGSGGSITIPDATFSEGDAVSIFNNTTGNITITCTITTAYIAGTDTDKATMTLATRGVATILFISGTVCVVSGNVT